MSGTVPERQARIDALNAAPLDPQLVHDRVFAFAERGMDAPESLSLQEIKQVCFALVARYTREDIG